MTHPPTDADRRTASRSIPPIVWLIVLVAFAARLAWIIALKTYHYDDSWDAGCEMGRLARNIVEGHGLAISGAGLVAADHPTPTAWFGPVYPYFLAAFFKLFGPYTTTAIVAAQIANSLISALTILPLYAIAARCFDRSTALIAVVAWALFPHAIVQANNLWLANLLTFALITVLWTALRCRETPSLRWAIATGTLLGITILIDGIAMSVAVIVGLWLLLGGRAPIRKRFATVVAVTVVSCVVVTPWMIRNHNVFGRWVPMRTSLGMNLFIGNNPLASGRYQSARRMISDQIDDRQHAALAQADEFEYSNELGDRAKEWIRRNPLAFVKLTGLRVIYFWLPESCGIEWSRPRSLLRLAFAASLLIAAAAGLIVTWRRAGPNRLLVWLLLGYPLGYYATVSNIPRYRFPLLPLLLLFAAAAAAAVAGVRKRPVTTARPRAQQTASE